MPGRDCSLTCSNCLPESPSRSRDLGVVRLPELVLLYAALYLCEVYPPIVVANAVRLCNWKRLGSELVQLHPPSIDFELLCSKRRRKSGPILLVVHAASQGHNY